MHRSKYFPLSKMLINYKGKGSKFTVEKPSRKQFNQAIEVNITSNKTLLSLALSYDTKRRTQHHRGTAKIVQPNSSYKNIRKTKWRIFDKINDWYSSKMKEVMKIGVVASLYSDHVIAACWCLCHCIIPTPGVQAEPVTCF